MKFGRAPTMSMIFICEGSALSIRECFSLIPDACAIRTEGAGFDKRLQNRSRKPRHPLGMRIRRPRDRCVPTGSRRNSRSLANLLRKRRWQSHKKRWDSMVNRQGVLAGLPEDEKPSDPENRARPRRTPDSGCRPFLSRPLRQTNQGQNLRITRHCFERGVQLL